VYAVKAARYVISVLGSGLEARGQGHFMCAYKILQIALERGQCIYTMF